MKLKPVGSISELNYLCSNGDQKEQYQKLAKIAASNLGRTCSTVSASIDWLKTNAQETDEEGVVDEINFCLDLV